MDQVNRYLDKVVNNKIDHELYDQISQLFWLYEAVDIRAFKKAIALDTVSKKWDAQYIYRLTRILATDTEVEYG